MIVGQSYEYVISCSGTENMSLTVCVTEYVNVDANSSALAVTKVIVNGGDRVGRVYLSGTIAVGNRVFAQLSEENNWVDLHEANVSAVVNGAFPMVSPYYSHGASYKGALTVQVNLQGSYPAAEQYFYGEIYRIFPMTDLSHVYVEADNGAEIGTAMNIDISSQSVDYVNTLRYVCGDRSGIIGEGLPLGIHVWTPPMELCYAITDSLVGKCTIYCDGYRDGTLIETAEVTVELRVPSGVRLNFNSGWMTLQPDNSGTAAEGLDCFVTGKSRVQAVFDDSKISYANAYGAQIVSRKLVVDGVEYGAPYLSSVVLASGDVSMGCSLYDSRGAHYWIDASEAVYYYALPRIVSASVFRCREDGTASDTGTCVSITADCRHSLLDGRSTAVITARMRSVNGAWNEAVTLTNQTTAVLWVGQLSAYTSYEVELKVTDSLGAAGVLTFTIPTAKVFFHGRVGAEGAAFGKYAESDGLLDVAWSLKTNGDLIVEGSAVIGGKTLTDWMYPVGAVCTCSPDVNPTALFGGTWAAAGDTVQRYLRTG